MTTPLSRALWHEKADAVRLLLEHGATPSDDAMLRAVLKKNLICLRLLIDYGGDVNAKYCYESLLHTACNNKASELVYELFNRGAHLNNTKELLGAVRYGYTDVVRDGIKTCKPYKADLNRLIHFAGNADIVDLLISHGARVETNHNISTPLYDAVQRSDIEVARCLIKHGANVNRIYQEKPILHAAAHQRNYPLVYLLLDNGADINAVNYCKSTILHIACNDRYTNIDDIKTLLDRGVDTSISACDYDGNSPIHFAITNHRYDIASLLIDRGADVMLKNRHDISPIMILIADRAEGRIDTNALARQLLADDSNPRHGKN